MSAEATYHIIFIASNISDKIYNYDQETNNNNTSASSSNNSDIIATTFSKICDAIKLQKYNKNIQYHICEWITNDGTTKDEPTLYFSNNQNELNGLKIDKKFKKPVDEQINNKEFYQSTFKHIKDSYYNEPDKTIVIFLAHSFGVGYFYKDKSYISTLDFSDAMHAVFGPKGVSLFFGMNCSIMNIENCILFDHSVELFMGSQTAFFPDFLNYDDLFREIEKGIINDNFQTLLVEYINTSNNYLQNNLPDDIPYFSISLVKLEEVGALVKLFNIFSENITFEEEDGRLIGQNAEILNDMKSYNEKSYDISTNMQLGWFDLIYALKKFEKNSNNNALKTASKQLRKKIEKIILRSSCVKMDKHINHWKLNGISFHIINEHSKINLTNILKEIFLKFKNSTSLVYKKRLELYWHLTKQEEIGQTFTYSPNHLPTINLDKKDLLPLQKLKNQTKINSKKT